jgi:hypothetical protein
MGKTRINVESEEDLRKLKELGTTWQRSEYTAVATIVGQSEEEVVFVLEK